MLDRYLKLGDERVEVRYVKTDRKFAEETLVILRRAIVALSGYFDLTTVFPRVRAILVPDRSEFDRLVADLLGVDIEKPSNPGRVAQPQKTDIVFLSPPAFKQHSTYEYEPDDFRRMIWHELVHVFEEYLTPDIETTTRWWSEGIAVYLSDQWRHESQFGFREPAIKSIRDKSVPDISKIQESIPLAYDFGWTIVKFIEDMKGKRVIARVVKEVRNGEIFPALGEEVYSFQKQWKAWLLSSKAVL
jgi:hypothetical protein